MMYSHEKEQVPRWRLWFALAAPVSAWAVHGLASVIIALAACREDTWPAVARAVLIGLSIVALLVALAGAFVGYTSWRRLASDRLTRTEGRDRAEMLALGGLWSGVVFTLGILWAGLPTVALVNVCEVLR